MTARKTLRRFGQRRGTEGAALCRLSCSQAVHVKRDADTTKAAFSGKILSLVIPEIGWRFAVVEDLNGAHHASISRR
jgi:hypothetical protein